MSDDAFEIIDYADRDDWVSGRQEGIGASDAAAILGENKYKSAYTLWAETTGKIQPEDLSQNEAVQFGTKLEGLVIQELAERTGRLVNRWPQTRVMVSTRWQVMRCTPDAQQWRMTPAFDTPIPSGDFGLIDAKTCGLRSSADWQDEPPLPYQIQLQHQLAVSGAKWGTLCCLIGGQSFAWFDIERNDAFIAALIAREQEFWDCVQRDVPPAIDGSESTSEALKKLYPKDSGESIFLTGEFCEYDDELSGVKATIKQLNDRETWLKNQFAAAIGEASEAVLPNGVRYTHRSQTRKAYEVKEATFRVLRKAK